MASHHSLSGDGYPAFDTPASSRAIFACQDQPSCAPDAATKQARGRRRSMLSGAESVLYPVSAWQHPQKLRRHPLQAYRQLHKTVYLSYCFHALFRDAQETCIKYAKIHVESPSRSGPFYEPIFSPRGGRAFARTRVFAWDGRKVGQLTQDKHGDLGFAYDSFGVGDLYGSVENTICGSGGRRRRKVGFSAIFLRFVFPTSFRRCLNP